MNVIECGLMLVKLTLLNVWLLPENGKKAPDPKLSCEVLDVKVRLALVVSVLPKSIGVEPESVAVPVPKFIVREFALFEPIPLAVKLYVARFNEPFTTLIPLRLIVKALPSVHSQPTPLTVMADANATPLVVKVSPVTDPERTKGPVNVRVNPVAGSVMLPWQISVDEPASVTLPDAGPAIVS